MRLTRIELNGFKRMLETGCNVDADLIALVGPNEAGKTTVLEALAWLGSGGELDPGKVNRTAASPVVEAVATAVFALDEVDRLALENVATDVRPSSIRYSRYQDGEDGITFHPPLTRRPEVSASVLGMVSGPLLEGRIEGPAADARTHVGDLAGTGREWDKRDEKAVEELIRWLEMPVAVDANPSGGSESGGATPAEQPAPESDIQAADLLKAWRTEMREPAPEAVAGDAIRALIPEFLLFSQTDRRLGFEYDLRPRTVNQQGQSRTAPGEDVEQPDGGLANLLTLGGTSIREIYDLVRGGVPERTSSHIRKVNRRLNERITPHWRQRGLQVRLEASESTLRVFVDDGDDTARFTDRSDGLRTFVALIAFLARHASEPPPILLIDEADTHLHYDAQADLINFLQALPSRTIYTTHSPGCLPLDLGTGVRVIRPDPEEPISTLSNNFWEEGQLGFNPLLFAMGAGAAAFSKLRAAVFTEGPSDMMLLPSLIREATGEKSLGYQVVPGLANIHPDQLGQAEFAAVRVAYLLDGDEGGDQHQRDLEKAGVPAERILRLAEGVATEDLIAPETYLEAVNAVLGDANRSQQITRDDIQTALDLGTPIAKAVEDALGGHRNAPGKVAVAGRLLRQGGLPLTQEARRTLAEHHARLRSLLEVQSHRSSR